MNYSDVMPFLSGLLLFALAGYSVRLARLFSAVRSGWLVFSSLAFLALLYLVLLASPFRGTLLGGARADITYALISLVLLVAMVRLEVLFKHRLSKESAARNATSEWKSAVEKQYEKLTEAHKELQESKNKLEARLAEQKRLQDPTRNNSGELLATSGQTEQDRQQATAAFHEQIEEYQRKLLEVEQVHQEQLAAARGVVEELGKTADALRVEADSLRTENRALRAEIENRQSEAAGLQKNYDRRQAEAQALQGRYEQQQADIDRLQSELNQEEEARKVESIRQKLMNLSRQPQRRETLPGLARDIDRLHASVDSVALAADRLAQSSILRLVQSGKLLRNHAPNHGTAACGRGRGRKVLPDSMGQLVRHLSGEHGVLVSKIENLRKRIEKIQTSVARQQSDGQVSPTSSTAAFAANQDRPSSNVPAPDKARTLNADLREHLINNVTETGTTAGNTTPEGIEPEEVSDADLEERELHPAR